MSTRCQIYIEGSSVLIYKHSDGYPDGVIPFLRPFVRDFLKYRGFDPEYMVAQCLRHWAACDLEAGKGQIRGFPKRPNEKSKVAKEYDFLGWGVSALSSGFHGDEAYIYVVKTDGSIEIRRPGDTWPYWGDRQPTLADTRLEKRIAPPRGYKAQPTESPVAASTPAPPSRRILDLELEMRDDDDEE